MSVLIWLQSVCKDYQQTALLGKELTAFEYFDYVTDKAALTTERNDVKSLLLFDYNTDELFDIGGNLSFSLCMLGNYLCFYCHLLTLFNP